MTEVVEGERQWEEVEEGNGEESEVEEEEVEEVERELGPKRTSQGDKDQWGGSRDYAIRRVEATRTARGTPQWLVHWQGLPDEGSTWEPESCFVGTGAKHLADFKETQVRMHAYC